MLAWIFLISSVMLYMLAHKVPDDVHPSAIFGLLAASLGLLLASVVKSFPNASPSRHSDGPSTTPPDSPPGSPPANLKFNTFRNMAVDDEAAWCIGTYYAVAFTVGDNTSEVGPLTEEIKSPTHTQPMFTLDYTPPSGSVQWYRAVEGVDDGNLKLHQMETEVVAGVTHYVDTDNPCKVPYRPDPPQIPLLGGGQFGNNNQWETQAGQGQIPWCKSTVYYATYVKADTNANESELSEPSPLLNSKEFTNPCLSVTAPRAGYEVNWYRQVLGDGSSLITLPLFLQENNPPKKSGGIGFMHFPTFTMLPPSDNPLNFEGEWEEGSPTVTIPVSLFVQKWNQALLQSPPNVPRVGELSIRDDGRLAMNGIKHSSVMPMTIVPASIPWWTAMGFSTTGLLTNTDLVADTPPVSGAGGAQSNLEFVGKGTQLIDRENPRRNPNRPNTGPAFMNTWRKEF